MCSVGCYGDRGHNGDIASGVELSAKVGLRPRGRKRPGEKGETTRGSPRLQWASKRARGRVGDGEFDGDGGRSPKRGTATWRRCREAGWCVASSGAPCSPPCLLWQGEAAGWHGPAQCWAGWAGQVGPGKSTPFIYFSVFCFYLIYLQLC